MYEHVEAHGPSLKTLREEKRARDVHHLRVYAAEGASPEHRAWVVTHHASEHDKSPLSHYFEDGDELLQHIREHASAGDEEGGE